MVCEERPSQLSSLLGGFLKELLGRPDSESAMLVLPVGYPAEGAMVPDLQRKQLDEIAVVFE